MLSAIQAKGRSGPLGGFEQGELCTVAGEMVASREPGADQAATRSSSHVAQRGLVLGALGVVFGDIGTSPLYTIQTVFSPGDPHPVAVSRESTFGIVSLIFWSVLIVVTLTYVVLVMRADNEGEGGILALITLIRRTASGSQRTKLALAALGIFGASLFLGDSMITPAISVLSAVEGLKVASPSLGDLVIPITVAIIIVLFVAQRLGTGAVGRIFGPVMIVWFVVIGMHPRYRRASRGPQGAVAELRTGLLVWPLLDRVLRACRGRAGSHRRRGALCRHGALRAWGDHPSMAGAGVSGVHPQLSRSGGADSR